LKGRVETYPHIDVAVDAVDSAALGYLRSACVKLRGPFGDSTRYAGRTWRT
jgi:hypothetical protein